MNTIHSKFSKLTTAIAMFVGALLLPSAFAQCPPSLGPRSTPTSDFILHGDGTVTHLLTGLMWKQCVEGRSGADCGTGTATPLSWADALVAAKNSGFATHRDWRLPSIKERLSIEESTCSASIGLLNPEVFGSQGQLSGIENYEWTSTTSAADPQAARTYLNNFVVGGFYLFYGSLTKAAGISVRLVRGTSVFDSLLNPQTLTFPAQTIGSRRLQPGATFSIAPLATGGSGNPPITYTAAPANVCTVSGTTVTQVGLGECVVTAHKDGNFTFSAAVPKSQSVSLIATLDIDLSVTASRYDTLTDALLVIRYLNNLTGTALVSGALGGTASITNPVAIKAYLDAIRPLLDIDGNGVVDVATDGVLIERYMMGFRGAALVAGALGTTPPATRNTAAIEAYLQALMP